MGILVALNHVTNYRYDRPVQLGPQTARLRPAPHTRSLVQSYSMKMGPGQHFLNWLQDPFGNYLARAVFTEKVKEFRVETDVVVDIHSFNPFDFFLEEEAYHFPFVYADELKESLAPYLIQREEGPLFQQRLAAIPRAKQETIHYLVALNTAIYNELKYVIRMEPGVQTCEETLSKGSGSCRDMAWLLCCLLRGLGLAARFASGYLIQLKPDQAPVDGPAGPTSDFTDLHAWTEVYLPGAGWVGLDPTSGLFAGEGHIPLSCAPTPSDAAPISGCVDECEAELSHSMTITRLPELPRPTRPYAEDVWNAADRLGAMVDQVLEQSDVRLTMGGEPTFVSEEQRTHTAWRFDATGGNKEAKGAELVRRLKDELAPGGALQFAQGKWYPGEILPRWAMHCVARKDGLPVWKNDKLLADPHANGSLTVKDAERFIRTLARRLKLPEQCVLTAREDAGYYLRMEDMLPVNGEPDERDFYVKAEHERMRRLKEQGLTAHAGYVLPLQFSAFMGTWISNEWRFRTGHLILKPGDSPLGLRLPLDSLTYFATNDVFPARSPFAETAPLPEPEKLRQEAEERPAPEGVTSLPCGSVRTALCAEVRGGVLFLFLPPLSYAEHGLELLSIIEAVAEETGIPVVPEGYKLPEDNRLITFSVTPDPGVLEVNIPPARSWEECKRINDVVYECARQSKLSAETFLVDGRVTGTGGGCHIVIGAERPSESPFLRRPDLLKSMVSFWQNHPSLSYLFSSLYVGPTSQAPRVDEARHDSLHELETAFEHIPPAGNWLPYWVTDRLFRNVLTDLTGNTHRAEFCIDKLYSPEGERGRLGLLEMRGFEMAPHPRMAAVQQLLVRACVAAFWNKPYESKLIRFGAALHDKYMLPQFLAEDLREALTVLRHAGFDFAPEWFDPFFEFRFPLYGVTRCGSIELELRMALEPWPVLGEELIRGTVSRAVDSSTERVQVKVKGVDDERYVLSCNGRRVPLRACEEFGYAAAGVRFKAWNPPSAMHPLIPAHTPLYFDVVDTRAGRSIGGCAYHASHPGGRHHDDIPINAAEAEGRRLSRFFGVTHTPGFLATPRKEQCQDFPFTLDLRSAGR